MGGVCYFTPKVNKTPEIMLHYISVNYCNFDHGFSVLNKKCLHICRYNIKYIIYLH